MTTEILTTVSPNAHIPTMSIHRRGTGLPLACMVVAGIRTLGAMAGETVGTASTAPAVAAGVSPQALPPARPGAAVPAGLANENNVERLQILVREAGEQVWDDTDVRDLVAVADATRAPVKRRMLLGLLYQVGESPEAGACLRRWIGPAAGAGEVTEFVGALPGLKAAHFDFITGLYQAHPSGEVRNAILDLGLDRDRRWRHSDYRAAEAVFIRFIAWMLRNAADDRHKIAALQAGYSVPGVNRDGKTMMDEFLAREKSESLRIAAYDIMLRRRPEAVLRLLAAGETPAVLLAGLKACNAEIERSDEEPTFMRFRDGDAFVDSVAQLANSSEDPAIRKEARKTVDLLRAKAIQALLADRRRTMGGIGAARRGIPSEVTDEEMARLKAMRNFGDDIDGDLDRLRLKFGALPEEAAVRAELEKLRVQWTEALDRMLAATKVVTRPSPDHSPRPPPAGEDAEPTVPEWIARLASRDASVRASALRAIAAKGPAASAAVEPLLTMIADANQAGFRHAAMHALLAVGPADPRVARAVVDAIGRPREEDRGELARLAREALPRMAPAAFEAEIPAMVGLLAGEPHRREVQRLLGRMGKPAADALFEVLERTPSPSERLLAIESLGYFQSPGPASNVVPRLVVLLKREDPEAKKNAMAALRAIGPAASAAIPELRVLLRDKEHMVRRHAQWALGAIGEAALPVLIEALGDGATVTRREALYAIGTMGARAESAIPAILACLDRQDTRADVVGVLAGMGRVTHSALPRLIELAKSDDAVAQALLYNLPKWKPDADEVAPFVVAHLHHGNGRIKDAALWCMGALEPGPAAAFQDVLALRRDADPQVRGAAARLLVKLDPRHPRLVETLVDMLADPSPRAQEAVCDALATVGPAARDAVPALARLLAHDDRSVRRGVMYALQKIGPDAAEAIVSLENMVADGELDREYRELAARTLRAIRRPKPPSADTPADVPAHPGL